MHDTTAPSSDTPQRPHAQAPENSREIALQAELPEGSGNSIARLGCQRLVALHWLCRVVQASKEERINKMADDLESLKWDLKQVGPDQSS